MDLASLIGMLGALGFIGGSMISSAGSLGPFLDVPSALVVLGGTFFAVMWTTPLPAFLGHFGAMAKCFLPPVKKLDATIIRLVELAAIARKDGMMALEGQDVPDKFFEKGMQLLVDVEKPIIQLPRIEIYRPEILIGIKALIAGPIGTLMRVGKGLLVNFRRLNIFLDQTFQLFYCGQTPAPAPVFAHHAADLLGLRYGQHFYLT